MLRILLSLAKRKMGGSHFSLSTSGMPEKGSAAPACLPAHGMPLLAALMVFAVDSLAELVTFDPPRYPAATQELNGVDGWTGTDGDFKVGPGLSFTGDGAIFVSRAITEGTFMRVSSDAITSKGTVSFDFRPGHGVGHPSFWLLLSDSTPPSGTQDRAAQLLFQPNGFTAPGPQFQLRNAAGGPLATSPLTNEIVGGGTDWYRIIFSFDLGHRISNPNGSVTTQIIHLNNGDIVWDVPYLPISEAVDSIDMFYINSGILNVDNVSMVDNIAFVPQAPPQITAIGLKMAMTLQYSSREGVLYVLEAAEDAAAPFLPTGTMQMGNGAPQTICDSIELPASRMYRVIEQLQ